MKANILFAILMCLALFASFGCIAPSAQPPGGSWDGPSNTNVYITLTGNINPAAYSNDMDTTKGISGAITRVTFINSQSASDATFYVIDDLGKTVYSALLAAGATANNNSIGNMTYGNISVQVFSNYTTGGTFPLSTLISWFRLDDTGATTTDQKGANTLRLGAAASTRPNLETGYVINSSALYGNGTFMNLTYTDSLNFTDNTTTNKAHTIAFWLKPHGTQSRDTTYLFHQGALNGVHQNDSFTNYTLTKACANTTKSSGTCADTNAVGGGQFTLAENASTGAAFFAYINITNTSLGAPRTTFDINFYGGFLPWHLNDTGPVSLDVWDNSTWVAKANITNDSLGWTNITGLDPNYYAWNNITQIRLNHSNNGSVASKNNGTVIDYVGLVVRTNTTLLNGTSAQIMNSSTLRWILPLNDSNVELCYSADELFSSNTWTHFLFSYNSTNATIYINGIQVASVNYTRQKLNQSTNNFFFGDGYNIANNSVSASLNASYDEVYFFNNTITVAQRAYIFAQKWGVHAAYAIIIKR